MFSEWHRINCARNGQKKANVPFLMWSQVLQLHDEKYKEGVLHAVTSHVRCMQSVVGRLKFARESHTCTRIR